MNLAKKRPGHAPHIALSSIEAARATLRSMLEEAPPASFRELICEVFDEIEGFRKNGRSWNEIHAHISAQIPIGIRTLQMYYRDESIRRTAKE